MIAPVPFEALRPPYRTVVADPPWQYDHDTTKADARKHYGTLPLEALRALPVEALVAEDAHLWLWTTNAMIEGAYTVGRAWGFAPLTVVTWCKDRPGVGHYVRNNTEHLLLFSRGRPMTPAEAPISSWYVWPRGAHSAKPAAALDLVAQVSPAPYLELFARTPALGWDAWGDGYAARPVRPSARAARLPDRSPLQVAADAALREAR